MASMYADSLRAFLRPIVAFLDDPSVTEVVVNGPGEVWIERNGRIVKTDATFSEEGLMAASRNIAQFVGRTLSEERPRLDARLPDGSRIHVVLPPIARKGAILAIRKFMREALTMQRLVELGTVTPPLVRLFDAAMRLRLNLVVAGGTGSGKTSLLNVLSGFVNSEERVVTIEDSAELQLQKANVISLESRPPDKFGKGEVTLADLLNSALRLRPDRIVVGEVRGGECFSLLQAMNTGHSGSMATTHANTPVDTLRRLETLCLMSGIEIPLVAIRAQVASAVNLVVVLDRLSDGTRKVTHVSEVLPLDERGEYRVQDLFRYSATGRDPSTQAVIGYQSPTGIIPTFFDRLRAAGVRLPESFFDPATYGVAPPPVYTAGLGDKTRRVSPTHAGADEVGAEDWEDAAALVEEDPTPDEKSRARVAPVVTPAPSALASPPAPARPAVRPDATTDKPPVRPTVPTAPSARQLSSMPTPPMPMRPIVPQAVMPSPVSAEPTIQVSEDLLSEVEMADMTPIQRTPVEQRGAAKSAVPLARPPAPPRPAAPARSAETRPSPAVKAPRPPEDTTDPHIRTQPAK